MSMFSTYMRRSWPAALFFLTTNVPSQGVQPPLRHGAIVDAPVDQVWAAFTTKEGLESWMAAKAEIELRVGGKMRTRYAADGTLGDAWTIENTILSFEPERMISIRATKCPEGFPYTKAIQSMWSVVRFEDLEVNRTRFTVTSMGFGDDEESKKMREHFDKGNAWTVEKLRAKFARSDAESALNVPTPRNMDPPPNEIQANSIKRIDKEIIVPASLKDIWEAWTTTAGVSTFFAPAANIELRPGGAYEMLFGPDQPKGLQGSEGCQILTLRPMEMLSFSWSAPPQWPDIRKERTVVVLQLQDLGKSGVRVTMTHLGFGEGPGWDEVHHYFTEAWPVVLGRLRDRFVKGAIDWTAVQRAREAQAKNEAARKGANDGR